jgi:hypothetical protein
MIRTNQTHKNYIGTKPVMAEEQVFGVLEKIKFCSEFAVGISFQKSPNYPWKFARFFVGWQVQEILNQIFYKNNRQESITKK